MTIFESAKAVVSDSRFNPQLYLRLFRRCWDGRIIYKWKLCKIY